MATSPQDQTVRISDTAQKNVLKLLQGIMTTHRSFSTIFDKMEAIDVAYARYVKSSADGGTDGKDAPAGDCLADDKIVAPIVVSQVDSTVAYLADVFLSGAPLFPVVSNPAKRQKAEELETLLDDHATLGGYVRQLYLFMQDGVKYNYSAIEGDWQSIPQFSVMGDFTSQTGQSIERSRRFYTALNRLDPYNTLRDPTVAPADVAEKGDYAGYIEMLTRPQLKRYLLRLSEDREIYNYDKALETHSAENSAGTPNDYRNPPEISNYIPAERAAGGIDWDHFFEGTKKREYVSTTATYQKTTFYARIIPKDLAITVPQGNKVQIWKFVVINNKVVVQAKRIISAFDRLPIMFGQPLEDGLGYQTQSVAEGSIPIQQAASTLFNIRFSAARRALADRALFDPAMISQEDINAKVPAPKIPVKLSALGAKKLEDAYKQIPFDPRGTEQALSDAGVIVGFGSELSGINGPQRGQFQRGNKSVQEWEDTMGASNNRLRLRALVLEHQVFVPLRELLKLNIYQYGNDAIVVSQVTGRTLDIKIDELRREVLSFRLADGFTPKSKLASTEVLTMAFNLIAQSPILQQAYGSSLPNVFAHMMQLSGVRGFEEYNPQQQQQAANNPNALQAPDPAMQQQLPPEGAV